MFKHNLNSKKTLRLSLTDSSSQKGYLAPQLIYLGSMNVVQGYYSGSYYDGSSSWFFYG
ncbi:hypothetical protein Xen7305DRAFT_00040740 [Xenococcus sp. PCC 7305]|nr:hypothetical protein Xen7305DRAFT_00040740 [Xenococcus sp. PCC 7305]